MEFFLRQLIAATGVLKTNSSASHRGDNCGLAPRDPAVYASGRQAGSNEVSARQWVEFVKLSQSGSPAWREELANDFGDISRFPAKDPQQGGGAERIAVVF
jgi:hypothetical protein